MSADNLLDRFQGDIVGKITSDSFFDSLLLLYEREGVTDDEVKESIGARRAAGGGKLPGAALLVFPPNRDVHTERSGPQYLLRAVVRAMELPKINRASGGTGKSANLISLRLDQLFHQFVIGGGAVAIDAILRYNDGEGVVGWDHVLLWRAGQAKPSQCTAPSIAIAGTLVTLTNNHSGATLYYTRNDDFPNATLGTAYAAPFNATSGERIRAAAYKTGSLGSDVPESLVS